MGCWNATCGLTRLPIHPGDPVVLFPLLLENAPTRLGLGGGFSETTDLAQPLSVGIRGEYNDYGGIDSLTGDSLGLAHATLSALPWHGEPVDEPGEPDAQVVSDDVGHLLEDLPTLLNEGLERGELYLSGLDHGAQPQPRKGSFMLVHAGALEAAKAAFGAETHWMTRGQTVLAHVQASVAEWFELNAARGGLTEEAREAALLKLYSSGAMHLFRFLAAEASFCKVLLAHDTPAHRAAVVELVLVNRMLGAIRTPWYWQAGAGSQEGVVSAYGALATFMQGYIEQDKRRYEDDADDEEGGA